MEAIAPSSGFTLSVWGSLEHPMVNGTVVTVHKNSISMIRVSIQPLYVLQIRPLLMTGNKAVLKYPHLPQPRRTNSQLRDRVREYWPNPSVQTLLLPKRTYTTFAEEKMKEIWWNVMDVIARFSGFTLSVWGSLKHPMVNSTAMTVHKRSISTIRV